MEPLTINIYLVARTSSKIVLTYSYIHTLNTFKNQTLGVAELLFHFRDKNMARSLKKPAKFSLRRVRINSPSIRFKPDSSSIERDQRIEFLGQNADDAGSTGEESKVQNRESEATEDKQEEEIVKVVIKEEKKEQKEQDDVKSFQDGGAEGKKEAGVAVETAKEEETEGGNRVMVVVDKALASTGALEWAITHTLQPQDTLFLLYFAQPFRKGSSMFPC